MQCVGVGVGEMGGGGGGEEGHCIGASSSLSSSASVPTGL